MTREADLLPDWFVGGAGKRRLLAALVRRDPTAPPWNQPPPWSKTTLAQAAGLHEKHTVFRHVAILRDAGLLVEDAGGFRLNERSPLLPALQRYLAALDA